MHNNAPPPPPLTAQNTAGGLLNRYDPAVKLELKVLCVGMYGTGKSTFLNRWETNLKAKTRTTINVDFYQKHVDGYMPLFLAPLESVPPPLTSPSAEGAESSGEDDVIPQGSPTHHQDSLTLDVHPEKKSSQLLRRGSSADYDESIPGRDYRAMPGCMDSTPPIFRLFTKAADTLRKASRAAQPQVADTFISYRGSMMQKDRRKKPLAAEGDLSVPDCFTLARDHGAVSGGLRLTEDIICVRGPSRDVTRWFRDGRHAIPTPGDASTALAYFEKLPLNVQVWDIQGQEHSRVMTRAYYADAFAALVFADVTRPETLREALLWKKDIDSKVFIKAATDQSLAARAKAVASAAPRHRHRHHSPAGTASGSATIATLEEEVRIPCWLILNKCDLLDSRTHQFPSCDEWRLATQDYKDLDDFCSRHGFAGWSLASGTSNINVVGVMDRVTQHCTSQFPREIQLASNRGKTPQLPQKPRAKTNEKCC